ncbi:MAG: translation initiation factor IF-2 subunit alpha [Candidatus Bathyarchaeia archaeon]
MTLSEAEWPEEGDLVVATVESITDYGAYVHLEEYKKKGFLYVSEISSSWVRNIRDFVREGQKVVLKVLRVNAERGQVDLSYRRVSGSERREKLLSWKLDKKAESLLRSAAERLKIPYEEIYEKAGAIIKRGLGLYAGLERAAKEGADVLSALGIPQNIAKVLTEVAREKIKAPTVKVKGTLQLQSTKPRGVLMIREALLNAQQLENLQGASVNVYVIAAPKYRIEVSAENYREAEQVLKRAADIALESITKAGGQGTFVREK